jgi:uncharacterized membrane protein
VEANGVVGRDGPVLARVVVSLVAGVAVAVVVGSGLGWRYAPAAGWTAAAAVFLVWTWLLIGGMSASETAAHATREDPTRRQAHVIVTLASVASVAGVIYLLVASSSPSGGNDVSAVVGVTSVGAAWFVVHTLYTLRYAELYYSGDPGGVDFNQDEPPAYGDFAYLSFTLGMTYQVSDTDLRTSAIRRTALRQALVSYLLGAVILAITINLVAGLGNSGS